MIKRLPYFLVAVWGGAWLMGAGAETLAMVLYVFSALYTEVLYYKKD